MTKRLVIITGASSGLGREFAYQIAEKFTKSQSDESYEFWLIARREERLQQLASELKANYKGLSCQSIVMDITAPRSYDELSERLKSTDAQLSYLVNAAGWGRFESVKNSKQSQLSSMILLNCKALVDMCHLALLKARPGLRIINIASSAGFIPMPGAAVYAASKSFVMSFSRALRHELKGTAIHVTAVCPKAVATEFFDHVGNTTHMEKSMKYFGLEQPKDVVRKALVDCEHNRSLSISSYTGRLLHFFSKFTPIELALKIEDLLGMNERDH